MSYQSILTDIDTKTINFIKENYSEQIEALILKETFEQLKIMSESAEDKISNEALINETIAFLIQDEVYQGDEVELRFICDNMDITMVEQCSCCGKVLMPDDECYSDELNDNDAALCNHCSIYNEETAMYQKTVHQDVIEKLTGYKFSPHLGNVGSKIEEFNYWINKHEHKFNEIYGFFFSDKYAYGLTKNETKKIHFF